MKATRAILIIAIIAAVFTSPACRAKPKPPSADADTDKKCIAIINKYFRAIDQQDLKGLLEVSAAQALSGGAKGSAYAKAINETFVFPLKAKLRKAEGKFRLYDVSITLKGESRSSRSNDVIVLKLINGQYKVVHVFSREYADKGVDLSQFKTIAKSDIKEARWYYEKFLNEAAYVKVITDRAAKRLPEDNCLRRTYPSKVRSLDPATCRDTMSADIQGHVFEGLYAYHYLKRPAEVIPMLADGMPKISADGLTWTIKIKKDVKYSRNPCFGGDENSKPRTRTVTADDFVLAFKRIADYHVNSSLGFAFVSGKIVGVDEYRKKTTAYKPGDFSRYDKEQLEGVVALDELTLRIKLRQPAPQFLHVIAMAAYAPFPREAIDYHLTTTGDAWGRRIPVPIAKRRTTVSLPGELVGTGPYILAEHIYGQQITFVRNPDFRMQLYPTEGAPGDRQAGLLSDEGKRLPLIDRIEMGLISPTPLSWKTFSYGQVDRQAVPADTVAPIIDPHGKLRKQQAPSGIKLVRSDYPAIYWIAINIEDPILGASKSLRQAMSLAIDREAYIKALFTGRAKPATGCLPSSIPGAKRVDASPYARFDLAAARAKMIDAKKELASAGLLKNGQIPPLTLDMGGTDFLTKAIAEFTKKQFEAIGLKVKATLLDWPTLLNKVDNGEFQMAHMGWHGDYPDPENFLQLYYSPNIKTNTNTTRYSNPTYDKLFARFAAAPYGPQRDKLCKQLASIISEDCPVLLLEEPVYIHAHHKWLYNLKLHPFGYGYARYLRIDAKTRAAAPPALGRE